MEKLIIDVPEGKSKLVKELLEALGVKITNISSKKKDKKDVLKQVSIWTEDEIKAIEEVSNSFNLPIKEW